MASTNIDRLHHHHLHDLHHPNRHLHNDQHHTSSPQHIYLANNTNNVAMKSLAGAYQSHQHHQMTGAPFEQHLQHQALPQQLEQARYQQQVSRDHLGKQLELEFQQNSMIDRFFGERPSALSWHQTADSLTNSPPKSADSAANSGHCQLQLQHQTNQHQLQQQIHHQQQQIFENDLTPLVMNPLPYPISLSSLPLPSPSPWLV